MSDLSGLIGLSLGDELAEIGWEPPHQVLLLGAAPTPLTTLRLLDGTIPALVEKRTFDWVQKQLEKNSSPW